MKITEKSAGPRSPSLAPATSVLMPKMEQFLADLGTCNMNLGVYDETHKICLQSIHRLEGETTAAEMLNSIFKHSEWMTHHILLTSFFTAVIAQGVPFNSQRTTEYAMMGALLHDIGFPALPPHAQAKNSRDLNAANFEIYQSHSILGAELVRKCNLPEPVAQIVLQHHEMTNSTGYPHKLNSMKMYPLAKIVSLANSFAEFIAERNLTPLKALKEFVPNRINIESHDPDAIRALIKAFIKGKAP